MDITISPNGYRPIDDANQVTYFTLTAAGTAYKWHGNTPVLTGQDLSDYLAAHAGQYLCGIYRKMYVEAIVVPQPGETELTAWTRWVSEGCKNTREIEAMVDGEVTSRVVEEPVPLKPWKDTHPMSENPIIWE